MAARHLAPEAVDVEPIDPERYYSVDAIADRLDLNPATVRLYLRTGQLQGTRVGPRQWRVKGSDLLALLERGEQAPPAP